MTEREARAQRRSTIADVLRELHELNVQTGLSLDDRFDRILAMGVRRFGTSAGTIARLDGDRYIIQRCCWGNARSEAAVNQFDAEAADSLCGEVLRSDGPVAFTAGEDNDGRSHPAHGKESVRTYLGAPITVDNQPFGTISFSDTDARDHGFDDEDAQAIALIAEWVGAELTRDRQAAERRQADQEAAMHDELTRLANRALLSDRIQTAIHRTRRVPDYKFAVLFLDFDRFKIINDSLGHRAGDELLKRIAVRLSENLRQVDSVSRMEEGHLAARIGGDEFVVLLDGITSTGDASVVAGRLQEALSEPYNIEGHEVISTASIGIVTSDGDYSSPDAMIRDADTAMYKAKTAGRARHVVFDEQMHEEAVLRLNLEKDLRRALGREQFYLLYQPIVTLEDGAPLGFEALIRWNHTSLGAVSPETFIPIAEETGLINDIGKWALREGLQQVKTWQERFPFERPLTMNINLSPRQLSSGDLIPTVRETLQDVGVSPETIKLEITESMVMDNRQDLTPVLHALRDLGVQLAMDDFGTGHSSLSCLHRFPLDVLKIDREFVWNMDEKREYAAVIQAIVSLAHTLNIKVVAEGIENANQLAQLQALDCDHAQGYYFARPLQPDAVERYLTGMSAQMNKSA